MTRLLAALVLSASFSPALAADPVRVHVNDPTAYDRPLNQCTIPHCTELLAMIRGAKESLDIAIYGIRNQSQIYQAILEARSRGVRVRVIVDKDIDDKNYYSSTPKMEADLGDLVIDDYQCDVRTKATRKPFDPDKSRCEAPDGFKGPPQCLGYDLGDRCLIGVHATEEDLEFQGEIMHNKFVVADGRVVWTGSTNISDSCSGGYNANVVAVIEHPEVARWYVEEFEQMYVHGRFHNEKIATGERRRVQIDEDLALEVFFSPQDEPMSRAVRPLLQNAKARIDIPVFYLTEKGVAGDLIAAHLRGVKVRVLLDATSATNGYSKHEVLRAAGIPVKVEDWGGKMHMKSAVIDSRVTIVGSMNWTSAGTRSNDENTVVIYSRRIAKQFEADFDRLWASVPDKWLVGRPGAESVDSPVACKDGFDNDYNHLADDKDPRCKAGGPPLPELPPHQIVPKADGHGLVKGVVLEGGRRIFYTPQSPLYGEIVVDPNEGGQWFCSEGHAWDAGFRRSRD